MTHFFDSYLGYMQYHDDPYGGQSGQQVIIILIAKEEEE